MRSKADHDDRIRLRQATPGDGALLAYWDKQPHVHDSDPNDDWNWEVELRRSPEWRALIVAELDGRPIGLVQIIDPSKEDSKYWGDVPSNLRAIDIWIGEKENLDKGYGTAIMNMALVRCFAEERVAAVLIDPLETNTRAHKFYERLGFQFVERRKFGKDNCFVYELSRERWRTTQ